MENSRALMGLDRRLFSLAVFRVESDHALPAADIPAAGVNGWLAVGLPAELLQACIAKIN